MNTKKCLYRNCGNLSTMSPKLTFFRFPLKDVAKCELWSQMAGCESINLKHQYLCENHFNTIYVSKTPRRTVLLPNAVPYRWNEKDGQYDGGDDDGEYHSEKHVMTSVASSREEILMDPLEVDDENDIIYTDTIEIIRNGNDEVSTNDGQQQQQQQLQQHHQTVEMLDVDAIVEDDDNVELSTDVNVKLQKLNAPAEITTKTNKIITEKSYGNAIVGRANKKFGDKKIEMVQQQQPQQQQRMSLPSTDEFTNHVTKRQKFNQPSVRMVDFKKTGRSEEQHDYTGITVGVSGNCDDIDDNADNAADSEHAMQNDDPLINNPDIATFNFKGEEYIQMPKRIYLEQIAKLHADLKRSRNIINNIKKLIDSTD